MPTTTTAPLSLPRHVPAAARAVLKLLQRIEIGLLDVQLPDGTQVTEPANPPGLTEY